MGRNGSILAVEEINATGGIHGRPLRLIVKDVGGGADSCGHLLRGLLDSGVRYVVGPYTSNMAPASMKSMEGRNAIMITPTMTTDMLEKRDDGILMMMPTNRHTSIYLADHFKKSGIRTTAVVSDLNNREYAQALVMTFIKDYTKQGGRIVASDSIMGGVEVASLVGEKMAQV